MGIGDWGLGISDWGVGVMTNQKNTKQKKKTKNNRY